jgi:RNA polymerase sigma factor (sigma-70 family)
VEAAQAGDGLAFDALVRAFQDRAVGFAYGILGDFHWAEDAAQESFLEAYRSLPSLLTPAAFPGWLRTIISRRCGRMLSGKQADTVPLADGLEIISPADSPERLAERNALREAVHAAIAALPENQRVAVSLHYIGEHSIEEISTFLQITPNAVKKRLQAARAALQERHMLMVEKSLNEHRPSRDPGFERRVRLFRAIEEGDIATVGQSVREAPELVNERRRREEDTQPSKSWGPQWGGTPLHLAAGLGDAKLAELFLDCGADIEARDSAVPDTLGATPLQWAARAGQLPTVKLLVERGADVNAEEPLAKPNLAPYNIRLAHTFYHPEIAAFLLGHGARPTIFTAVAHGSLDSVRELAESEPGVIHARMVGAEFTPLHMAARKNLPEMVDVLAALGADISPLDHQGRTPIDLTLIPGNVAAYQRLIAHGAVASNKWLALCGTVERAERMNRFVWSADPAVTRQFLKAEPDLAKAKMPNFWPDNFCGATALHFAAWIGKKEVADVLLEYGADILAKDERYGGTPTGWAAENNQKEMVEYLISRGGKLDQEN